MTVRRLGIIGAPVTHSVSPPMQQAALDALGLEIVYERWPTSSDELSGRIESLRKDDIVGANVTVPHKQAVIEYLDEVSPLATLAGAVNTIVNRNGRLYGDNTDVYGFATSLRENDPEAAGRSTMVLGAGGAARGVVLALVDVGITEITIVNRSLDRALQLRHELRLPWINVAATPDGTMAGTRLLINTTSLGWHRGEMPIEPTSLERLPADALVADLTYRDTDLLDAATARGLATFDGLGMLVHQGVLAFQRFTGAWPPVDLMWQAASAARLPRS